MKKIFLINFPSLTEINFNRYFTFLNICGIQNPVDIKSLDFKPFCSGYTISFNIDIIKEKFKDALFVHFRTNPEVVYKQILFCRENCIIDTFVGEDFKEYLNLDISNFSFKDIKDKNFEYTQKINDLFKENTYNFIDLGLIDNFTNFISKETKLKDFFYIHGLDNEFNIISLKESIKNKETTFFDYLSFDSNHFQLPTIYSINSLVTNFIFRIPFNLEHHRSYAKNLRLELQNVY